LFDVEHVLFSNPDDPKIREITTRMSRYVCNLESEQERMAEKAYIVETAVPIIFSRYTPDKVTSEKHVYLITKQEKSGSRIFLVPGVIALIMFIRKGPVDDHSAKLAQSFFMDYFIKQIEGAYADGNDVLIDGKKIMGFTVMYNNTHNTMMLRFMLTLKSELLMKSVARDEDFTEKKYSRITGVCDETGMDEDTIRKMICGFVEIALAWRLENAAD